MFPTLKVRILSGLSPSHTYLVFLELRPFDDKRYRYVYHSSQWMVAGAGDTSPSSSSSHFVHGDSPTTGQQWMGQVVSFDKLKLTNNRQSSPEAAAAQGHICLHSMHKYVPRIHIQKLGENELINGKKTSLCKLSFVFYVHNSRRFFLFGRPPRPFPLPDLCLPGDGVHHGDRVSEPTGDPGRF